MKILSLDRTRTFSGIVLLGLLALTARNAVDPDLWWHLRTGQLIVETGHVPHSDPFSFTRIGAAWVSHEWLSEAVFFEIWKHAGMTGLIAFSSVVTTAAFMLLYLRCPGKSQGIAATTVVFGALAATPAWGVGPVRAQMFTLLLASLLLWLLERGQERPLILLWIPPIFLLWLNLHAGFALCLALLLAYAGGLAWERLFGGISWATIRAHLLGVLSVLAACVALVPLNPSGAQLYLYPLNVLRSIEMRSFIVEWLSPDFHQLRYLPVFLLWLALVVALASSRSRPKARILAPTLLAFCAAMDAVRHIPIFVLLAVPVIAGFISEMVRPTSSLNAVSVHLAPNFRLAFRSAVLLLMAGFALTRWHDMVRDQSRAEVELYPSRAIEFLRSHPARGRLFAYYDWGGYAIWRLSPEVRVFVDGRADLYGDDLLKQFQTVMQLRPGWEAIVKTWNVEAVLVPPPSALAQALTWDSSWQIVYQDSQAVLFFRTTSQSEITPLRDLARQLES